MQLTRNHEISEIQQRKLDKLQHFIRKDTDEFVSI